MWKRCLATATSPAVDWATATILSSTGDLKHKYIKTHPGLLMLKLLAVCRTQISHGTTTTAGFLVATSC